jgi:hypothetical protein
MPNRNRAKNAGGGGRGGLLSSFIVFLILAGVLFAFMRVNHLNSFDSIYKFILHKGQETAQQASTVDLKKYKICNFIDNPDCVYQKDNLDKIGDVNGDGKVDESDADAYKSQQEAHTQAEQSLDQLVVSNGKNESFSAADYPHWTMVSASCDSRESILKSVGFKTDSTCRPITGSTSYTSPYDGKKTDDPSELDIDHIIPLVYANNHGASSWSKEQKTAFANDVSQLVAVSSDSANKKGDNGPSGWLPQSDYQCTYASDWVNTAIKYHISVTSGDKKALKTALQSCSQ